MTATSVRQQKTALRYEVSMWQKAALGLLGLSTLVNMSLAARIAGLEDAREADAVQYQARVEAAERVRDLAARELGAMALQQAEERQAREAQAEAYAALEGYRYIGECTVTAYCPCAECCGKWADGITAAGLPAGPGIVAVDPEVIPLGSTVIIDGQKYLAADTGASGYHVDICFASHREAEAFGVQTAEVWVAEP